MGAALNILSSAAGGGRPRIGPVPGMDVAPDESGPAAGALLRKVLVVDDERDLADMAETLLGSRGLEVRVAYSARDALQVLESDPEIDAVFSDVMMPGMTGLELAEAIRRQYPCVKIVLTSGFTAPALLAGQERSYLYASKPYSIETVLKLLRS